MERKPRSDAKLLNLPPEQQERLCEWLLEGVETDAGRDTAYAAVSTALFMDFNVKTSTAALSEFYRQVCAPRRLRRAAVAANEFAGVTEGDGELVNASKTLVRQKYFELLAGGDIDPTELNAFASAVSAFAKGELEERKLALKEEAQKLAERRVVLLETNAAEAKQKLTAAVAKGGLTPETLRQIEEAAALL